jgi:hypothetical protein
VVEAPLGIRHRVAAETVKVATILETVDAATISVSATILFTVGHMEAVGILVLYATLNSQVIKIQLPS